MTEVATKERGILFNGEMVRAILEGRKVQTRRPVKEQDRLRMGPGHFKDSTAVNYLNYFGSWQTWVPNAKSMRSPFGLPGDRLWVRETWGGEPHDDVDEHGLGTYSLVYRANLPDGARIAGQPWRPSTHMPRWASRITLEVQRVWVERLLDISEADALAEGCPPCPECADACGQWGRGAIDDPLSSAAGGRPWSMCGGACQGESEQEWFQRLWDSIYAAKGLGWGDNPWVWCCEFKRVEQV